MVAVRSAGAEGIWHRGHVPDGPYAVGRARVIHPRGGDAPADVLLHEGGTGGFRAFAAVVPATGASVVVLANQARDVTRLGMQVLMAA